MKKEISINELTNPLVELLIKEKDRLGIEVHQRSRRLHNNRCWNKC